jgi:hypothetical protein
MCRANLVSLEFNYQDNGMHETRSIAQHHATTGAAARERMNQQRLVVQAAQQAAEEARRLAAGEAEQAEQVMSDDISMRDRSLSRAGTPSLWPPASPLRSRGPNQQEVYVAGQEIPRGWVLDIDRTDPGSQVLKRIDGLFYAARGKQNFLLAFPNRSDNPQNQRFECKELEDTAKFPVEKRTQWLADHGEIYSEKAPVSSLRGRSWRELNIRAVAYVRQSINVRGPPGGHEIRLPKVHAVTVVEVANRGQIMFYDLSALVTKFGDEVVRPRIDEHIRKTGQLAPLTPPPGRRGREYSWVPLSRYVI